MSEQEPKLESQLAFFKIWAECMAKLAQSAFSFSPDAVPPEMLRQMRAGMLRALAQSWDEFLRSPQFMEGMKQMMENALAFRKLSTEFLTKAQQELGGVTVEDVDGLVGAVRNLEARVLERLGVLSQQIEEIKRRLDVLEGNEARPRASSLSTPQGRQRQSRAKRRA
jgi:hypothetical protein